MGFFSPKDSNYRPLITIKNCLYLFPIFWIAIKSTPQALKNASLNTLHTIISLLFSIRETFVECFEMSQENWTKLSRVFNDFWNQLGWDSVLTFWWNISAKKYYLFSIILFSSITNHPKILTHSIIFNKFHVCLFFPSRKTTWNAMKSFYQFEASKHTFTIMLYWREFATKMKIVGKFVCMRL